MTEIEKAIGKIYGRAAEHKITIREIAEESGVNYGTISYWRCQRTSPSLKNYLAVSNALERLIESKNRAA